MTGTAKVIISDSMLWVFIANEAVNLSNVAMIRQQTTVVVCRRIPSSGFQY